MALNNRIRWPSQTEEDLVNYPFGKAKNVTTDTATDGTPFEKDYINDQWGFFQKLLHEADITPNDTPDTIVTSQYFDAARFLFGSQNWKPSIKDLLEVGTVLLEDSYQIQIGNYHEDVYGGGGVYEWIPNLSKEDHNGGTIIDPEIVFPLDWNDEVQREVWFTPADSGFGCWRRVFDKSLNVKWFGAKGNSTTDDTLPLQSCFDVSVSDIYIPRGGYLITEALTLPAGRDLVGQGAHNETILLGDLPEGLIYNLTGQWWKNTFKNIVFQNQNENSTSAGIKGTFYQCTITRCGFTCKNGKGLHLLGNDYCVENIIKENYFNGCKYPIYAETGSSSNTDSFIIDNLFWKGSFSKETTIENDIYWENGSGCTFRGNHPYGGANDAMLRLVGGVNVSILDNYFEESNNPRIKISGGNPSSFSITGNKFWRGDGEDTDVSGDKSSIISLGFNLYNRCGITLGDNIFEGGSNEVPIFSFRNGALGISDVKINFDSSNIINGSYSLADLASSGSADVNVFGRINSDHSEFVYENSVQNVSATSVACSEFHQYDTGNATTFMTLPNHTNCVQWKPKVLRNFSTITNISLSTGGTIENNRSIKPSEVVILRAVNSNTYRLEFIKEAPDTLTVTTYPLVPMDFGVTSVPANSYVESNIDIEGYVLTNPETVLTCVMKGLAAGLTATLYYDGATYNTWKVRISNLTGSSVTLNSTTAIVNVFST